VNYLCNLIHDILPYSLYFSVQIVSAHPGFFSFLDYTKSDVWAAGALAYEIFGCANPFYGRVAAPGRKLQNDTYAEKDLPDFPGEMMTV